MSGTLSRYSKQRTLNVGLWCQGSNVGDVVATVTTGITAGTTGTTSLACSGGTTRSIPSGSVILCQSTTGTAVEAYTTSGSTASAATSITVVSQTSNKARVSGDLVTVILVPQAYLTLCTAAPTDSTLGTEYTGTGMARQPVTYSTPTAADPPATGNTALLTFGPMTAGTGTAIPYAQLMDALTGGAAGNAGARWTLTTSKNPGVGDSVTVASATGSTMTFS